MIPLYSTRLCFWITAFGTFLPRILKIYIPRIAAFVEPSSFLTAATPSAFFVWNTTFGARTYYRSRCSGSFPCRSGRVQFYGQNTQMWAASIKGIDTQDYTVICIALITCAGLEALQPREPKSWVVFSSTLAVPVPTNTATAALLGVFLEQAA